MKITRVTILVISLSVIFLFISNASASEISSAEKRVLINDINPHQEKFKAVNDTFYFITNCINDKFFDNVLNNDVIQETEEVQVCYVFAPKDGLLTFGSNGNFMLIFPEGYSGTVEFSYTLCNKSANTTAKANVVVFVENDNDCDGVVNNMDLDNDNDGILDADEGSGTLDSDNDGIPDNFDIDSDNDGIPDIEEWQKEGYFVRPFESDMNKNGWDDAFDTEVGGTYYKPIDTDKNGIPDYIDTDSDGDGVTDIIEGFENDIDEISLTISDCDNDGLDDIFDTVSCWSLGYNSVGSNAPLPDLNKNGIREWRDYQIIEPEENSFQRAEINVYPNPSSGVITIDIPILSDNNEIILQIINMQGIEIRKTLIAPGSNKIDLLNIMHGNYILQLVSGKEKVHTKITIQ